MHTHWMNLALEEAELARSEGEVPIGAVVVHEERLIARAHNQREQLRDPTAHAEMIALTQAAAARQSWRLDGCVVYVTLEPCPMCAGAMVQARIDRLVFRRGRSQGRGRRVALSPLGGFATEPSLRGDGRGAGRAVRRDSQPFFPRAAPAGKEVGAAIENRGA